MHRRGLGFLHRSGDLAGGEVDGRHQIAQLIHRVIDGVGDGAGEVLGDRSSNGQVAIGQVFDFIQQPHDRVLVALVLLCGFVQLAVGFADHHQANQDDRHQRQQTQHIAADGIDGTPAGEVFEGGGQVRSLVEQGLRQVEDVAGRFADLEQLWGGLEDFVHRTGDELEELADFAQACPGIAVLDLGYLQGRVTLQHAIEHLAKTRGVAPEGVGGLAGVFVPRQHGIHRAEDPFGQQRLALGHGHLGGRRAALQQDLDDFFVLDLQLRHGFGQGRRHLV